MKTKNEIIEILNSTELDGMAIRKKTVEYSLVDAEVVFAQIVTKSLFNSYRSVTVIKVIAKDPVLGSVFFQTSSEKLFDIERGDRISLVLSLTGVGTPSEKYPDPIIFAKALTRKRDSVHISKKDVAPAPSDDDISVNV